MEIASRQDHVGSGETVHGVPQCRRVIIVGAGGLGAEVWNWAHDAWGRAGVVFSGFLDADPGRPRATGSGRVIGDPATHQPQADEGFVLAIGIQHVRRRVVEILEAKGARFLSLVHPTAIVAPTATVGTGAVLCPYAIVSAAVRLGRFTLVNYHASLGHDAATADFAVLSPYATLGGHARAGADAVLGLHASLGPGKTLGDGSKISANSCALVDVPPRSLVYGVPGRVSPLLSADPVGSPNT